MTDTTVEKSEFNRGGSHKDGIRGAVSVVALFSILYAIECTANKVAFLSRIAIHPLKWKYFYTIGTYAFGHVSTIHLVLNMFQLGTLSYFVVVMVGLRKYLWTFLFIFLGSGLFLWSTSDVGTMIVGASGITAGMAGYLLLKSWIAHDGPMMSIAGIFTFLILLGIFSTIHGNQTQVSWQAHIGGLLTGVIVAAVQILRDARQGKVNLYSLIV